MKEKIAIIIDSASDLPSSVANQDNVFTVPMRLTFGTQDFLDRQNITPTEFYQKLQTTDQLPTTSAPSLGDVIERMQLAVQHGFTHAIVVTISAGLSVTNQVFDQAGTEVPELITTVFNTKSVGIGSGLVAVAAQQLIQRGLSFTEVNQQLNQVLPTNHVFFYIPSLKYLQAGGRIGRVTGLLAGALNIKPIISCDDDGIYYPVAKGRTEKKAVLKMIQLALDTLPENGDYLIAVANGDDPQLEAKVTAHLSEETDNHFIYTGDVSPTLGVHTGPGLVGIAVQPLPQI